MENHVKNYFAHFGYDTSSFIACEVCGAKANQIHHVIPRSKFGKKTKHLQDAVSNLAALCFSCHDKIHNHDVSLNERLKEIVLKRK